jgi:hypothetical protein
VPVRVLNRIHAPKRPFKSLDTTQTTDMCNFLDQSPPMAVHSPELNGLGQ